MKGDNNKLIVKKHTDSQDIKSQTEQTQESKRDNKQQVREQNEKNYEIRRQD